MLTRTTTPARGSGRIRFRAPEPADGQSIWALADQVGLDLNSVYAYVMWADHHAQTSVVAELDGALAGFTIGFAIPAERETLFVWQIGVDARARGQGLAGQMLDELVKRTGASMVEATVTPDNTASTALFRALGTRHGTVVDEQMAYPEEFFPDGHAAEVRFRIPVATT